MVDHLILTDGRTIKTWGRAINYPDEAWTFLSGKPDAEEAGPQDYFKAVPWLYRGVQMRADAVASMPFAVYKGEEPFDESETWANKVDFMPSPRRMLRLLEMSLCLTGTAYQFRVMRGAQLARLKYLNPFTMERIADTEEGLTGFTRTIGSGQKPYGLNKIVYYWLEDPFVEDCDPPDTYPAKAALMASGVIANVDEFVAAFFKRGAIKATLLTMKGNPPEPEKERLKEWWGRVVAGVKNAFGAQVINAEAITPVVVGEGLEGLQNQGLTAEKREDIATALGIPQTKLFSSSASGLGGGGVVEQDDKRFLQDTIIPECNFIADVLNEQVFKALGLRFDFRPETLDAFQQDEQLRANAYSAYVGAGMPPSVAAEMIGLELPDGVTYESLDEWELKKFERTASVYGERFGQQQQSKEQGEEEEGGGRFGKDLVGYEDSFRGHLAKWQRKAMKRGPGKAVPFDSVYISPTLAAAIEGGLEATTSTKEIEAVFANAMPWGGYP